jgi:hypothetical protein
VEKVISMAAAPVTAASMRADTVVMSPCALRIFTS